MEAKTIVINFLLVGLAILCLFSAIAVFSTDNETSSGVLEDPAIASMTADLGSKINESRDDAVKREESFKEEGRKGVIGTIELVFFSILDALNLFIDTSTFMASAIFGYLGKVFGVPDFVVGTISAILIFILILAAWRVHKAGS